MMNVGVKKIPDGAIYEVNRDTGVISMVGLTGYSEVSALGVRYSDPIEIWGWARGGDGKKQLLLVQLLSIFQIVPQEL
jgi:hypothetical protein